MDLIFVNQSTVSLPRAFIKRWVLAIEKALPVKDRRLLKGKELTVVFLSKPAARKLNRQFRGRNYATDVLSFPANDENSMGDLVICPEVIQAQAKEHQLSVQHELGYMVLHGLLHLLGYDHEASKSEAKRMFTLQDRLFGQLTKKL